MRRQSIVFLAGAIGLLVVGCSAAEEPEVSTSPSPTDKTASTDVPPFNQPLVASKPGSQQPGTGVTDKIAIKQTDKVAGLLESTDPDERAKRVQASIRSRTGLDPFASLPPILTFSTPVETQPASGQSSTTVARGSSVTGGSRGSGAAVPSIPAFPQLPTASGSSSARGTAGTGSPGQSNPGLAPLPQIPEPTLARSVEVTGVVTAGGTTKAIVKAPNEPTGRYVEVGQRLSNGQVLVKRIEANAGSDPIVILEENGVEVARRVGDKPVVANSSKQQNV
jgi:hypothetical protein